MTTQDLTALANQARQGVDPRLHEAINRALFVEVNGGELVPITEIYTLEGCARYVIYQLRRSGRQITPIPPDDSPTRRVDLINHISDVLDNQDDIRGGQTAIAESIVDALECCGWTFTPPPF